MKIIKFVLNSFTIFYTSADPNLFGSRKRRKEKARLAGEFKKQAEGIQEEIDILKTQNPFESAAAKSAMTSAARKARQYQQRFANVMGGTATPESMIAAQQASQEALAGTAGQIVVGSEANKAAQLAQLRGEKASQMAQYGGLKQSAIEERGSGWKSFFQDVLPAVSGLMEGGGSAMSAMGGSEGAAAGGAEGASAAAAALSDMRMKENISYIGELQGRKIYKYNIKGDPSVHIGILSQEIEITDPDKVVEVDGVKKVYYDKVFKTIE